MSYQINISTNDCALVIVIQLKGKSA